MPVAFVSSDAEFGFIVSSVTVISILTRQYFYSYDTFTNSAAVSYLCGVKYSKTEYYIADDRYRSFVTDFRYLYEIHALILRSHYDRQNQAMCQWVKFYCMNLRY